MTTDLHTRLMNGAAALGVPLSPTQSRQLIDFLGLLDKWNQVYNLTAVREVDEMLVQHVLDSMAAVPPLERWLHKARPVPSGYGPVNLHDKDAAAQAAFEAAHLPKPLQVLDVGSGGGLPGVVFAVCCPGVTVTCVDTVGKKAAFVQQVAVTLRLPNLRTVHARVEELTGPFDLISSRAFASLADFTCWSAQALAPHGVWLAMKGKQPQEEIGALDPAIAQVFHVEPLTVPSLDAERCIIWMRKPAAPIAAA
jgi:16S rRNA (guanine527-N7)-methyltransferase